MPPSSTAARHTFWPPRKQVMCDDSPSTEQSASNSENVLRRVWWMSAGIVVLAGVGTLIWFLVRPSNEEILDQARVSFARADYQTADELVRQVLGRSPKFPPALLLAARCAIKLNDPQRAVRYVKRVKNVEGEHAATLLCEAGDLLLLDLRHASAAEQRFRSALKIEPDNFTAVNRLAYLLTLEGRVWESLPFFRQQVRMERFTADHLLMLGMGDAFVESSKTIEAFRQAVPDDPVPLIGRARTAINENRNRQAESWLREVVDAVPNQVEAQALLGRVLLESQRADELLRWHQRLPEEADRHPMIWLVRGLWAQQRGEKKSPVRCFWESVRRDPNQKSTNYKLGQALVAAGEQEKAAPFLRRARQLEQAVTTIEQIHDRRTDTRLMRRAAGQMESLGRLWEAWGWSRAASAINPNLKWAQQKIARLRPRLKQNTPWTIPEMLPGQDTDWSAYPLPNWTSRSPASNRSSTPEVVSRSRVSFVDSASAVGLQFDYFASEDPQTDGKRMFEQMGGGVAVLDYDADGWPDIYLAQGCSWPPVPNEHRHWDRLFRNLGNGRFADVTDQAVLAENRYSQGVTIGDFDNDGFPDLYVANIGENRFFRNNGDGTFTDITEQTATAGDRWTTSCLLADLNGDTLPDLYAVNYLSGPDLFSHICATEQGRMRACSPKMFAGAPDRLYLNLGDGRFENVTKSAGITAPDGKGLGIVAGDFNGTGLLSLFIANDQTPNFFYRNRTKSPGAQLSFEENGFVSGLAFDRDGLALACMGVAAGDANGDGLPDLFVTNFSGESNTLYVQRPGRFFIDATREAGLRSTSFMELGFGTQFLDGELDGWPDLVLANGHVDDFTFRGQPYKMRTQYYRNLGEGRFTELSGETLGDYFQGEYLGRALATLDWNRDGREDFVVTHLDAPAALLTNQTPNSGHFLAVRFRGVKSARDAIGTVVRLTVAKRTWTQQLTAGDGFQASNQRQLIFGLGDCDRVDCLDVRWPSGVKQRFEDLAADAEWILIEGQSRPVEMLNNSN